MMVAHLSKHTLCISAPTVESGPTRRPTAALLWSTSGKPFRLSHLEGRKDWVGCAALVAPQYVRSTQATECGLISLNFEPGHPYFSALARMTVNLGIISLDWQKFAPYSADVRQLIGSNEVAYLDKLTALVAECVLDRQAAVQPIDRRIATAAEQLEVGIASPPTVSELAKQANLSEDRFSHLFTAQIGLSVRSYVVWRRYRRALLSLRERGNLTALAQNVGFYDQAQMTRTFVGFFGYQPSLLRDTDVIRLIG